MFIDVAEALITLVYSRCRTAWYRAAPAGYQPGIGAVDGAGCARLWARRSHDVCICTAVNGAITLWPCHCRLTPRACVPPLR